MAKTVYQRPVSEDYANITHPDRKMSLERVSRRQPRYPFVPRRGIRTGAAQTFLGRFRPAGVASVLTNEQMLVLDAGEDRTAQNGGRTVQLHGYLNMVCDRESCRGLILLLHGWEGSSHAVYNLSMANLLLNAGYDIFRLNLRDHGPGIAVNPYALNRGFFLGTLIDEVAVAAERVSALAGAKDFHIVGLSLGGNFALRLAIRNGEQPIHRLRRVIAVNPAINPLRATRRLDKHPVYRRYFRNSWLNSMYAKQQLFPDLIDAHKLSEHATIYQMTDWIVRTYTSFKSADEYFSSYRIHGHMFRDLTIPTTLITARDDDIIPVVDFYAFAPHPLLDIEIHRYGGHVGFIDAPPLHHALPDLILKAIEPCHSVST